MVGLGMRGIGENINRSHIHTPTANNTPDTDTHTQDKNSTPNQWGEQVNEWSTCLLVQYNGGPWNEGNRWMTGGGTCLLQTFPSLFTSAAVWVWVWWAMLSVLEALGRWREETIGRAWCLTLRYSLPLSVWVDPLAEHSAIQRGAPASANAA